MNDVPPIASTVGRAPFFLEKWYVDTLLEDGSLLIVLLGELRAFGLRRTRASVELYQPDGSCVRGDASVGPLRQSSDGRKFDGGHLGPNEITWRTPSLSGWLRFASRYPPGQLRDPLLVDGKRKLRWLIEVPDADVDGEIRWGSSRQRVEGRGYRDYLALDLLPWRVPFRELRWGRAVAGEHAGCWISLRLHAETLAGTWNDGVMMPGFSPPSLEEDREIQATHVAELPILRIGLLRAVLKRLAGDPHQTRALARTSLDGVRGWAVHEVVRWR